MPLTPTSGDSGPRRRSLLAGALYAVGGTGLLSGCTGGGADSGPELAPEARRVLRTAAGDSTELLARYDGTATAHPGLAERLKPLRGEVARHLDELIGATWEREPTEGGKGKSGKKKDGPSAVPADERGALAALADAERRTAEDRTRALADVPPELARLLASVAASGAAHAYLLTEGDR
ncbi:hypothetical protein LHJ74_33770 [Streptomyces sp. N2-109]|uniref:Lipoprotein n=1 Tax=Streptomyces gossypii TaxID=2883101 RepID=A0ABT2K3R9_9ACTN|nr:hypothetical protein [Streptomyces gossypii]MCT2594823.1 hypothetical protein [Streptomyces gossypii]